MRSQQTIAPELPSYLRSLLADLNEADAFELDRRLRKIVALEQRLDAEIGELLAIVAHEGTYVSGGYRSMEEYARDGLGMAAGKVRTLLRLERSSTLCPILGTAYRRGQLSWVQAGSLARVATIPHRELPNGEAWVQWATKVSVRRLRKDVEWALLLSKTEPERFAATGGLPEEAGQETGEGIAKQADEEAGDEAAWLRKIAHAAAGSVTEAGDFLSAPERQIGARPSVFERDPRPGRQIGARPSVFQEHPQQHNRHDAREDTMVFFHAPSDITRLFRAVLCTVRRRIEKLEGRLPTEGEAFEAMLEHVFDAWGAQGRRRTAAHRVFERDGWRCTAPGCSSLTDLHDHHIMFRSAGGSNDLANRTTLCVWHHLRGVHGGTVRCVGKAPGELRFELGVRRGKRPLLAFGRGDRRVA